MKVSNIFLSPIFLSKGSRQKDVRQKNNLYRKALELRLQYIQFREVRALGILNNFRGGLYAQAGN
jgi:hypothetical protein